MIARTRWRNWLVGTVALGLSFLLLAGCRSSSGSRSSGCGGGCCRSQGYEASATQPPAVSAVPVRPGLEQPESGASGLAVKELPATTASTPAQALYGGQKTCPVMGEELGSMGPAIPVTVKGQTIYVCCRGCASKLQRDPDVYLAKVQAERSGP